MLLCIIPNHFFCLLFCCGGGGGFLGFFKAKMIENLHYLCIIWEACINFFQHFKRVWDEGAVVESVDLTFMLERLVEIYEEANLQDTWIKLLL